MEEIKKIPEDFENDVFGNIISFDGNTNLKKVKTQLPFTKEHVEEYMKCKNDWKYFAENYYHILSLKEGLIVPKLRDYQTEMIESYVDNRFTMVLASRQCGKSTSFEIFICWVLLFQKDQRIAVLANKAEQSYDVLRKVKEAYELLPKWLQQGVKVWNAGRIKLENGSMVIASSTSSTAIRGKSIGLLIVDERAFIPNNVWDAFISSVYPTISSVNTSKVIYVSTPNGLNHFYKDWMDSIEGKNEFNHIRVDWWQVPDRDEKWKLETIANIGMLRFAQEYGNDFLGSSDTLIPKAALVAMKHKNKYVELPEKLTKMIQEKYYNYINLYEEPKEDHIYSMGIDSSKMTEESKGDALAIQILDITQLPYKQVASFHARSGMNYLMIPPIAAAIGNYYNGAYAFVENNEIGQEVANNLNYDYEYENTFFEKNALPGFRTTKKTKYVGYTNLETLIANEKLIINDFETIHELSTFVRKKDSYKADKGYKDDLVMAMLAALYFMQRKEYDAFDDSKHMLERISEIVEKPMSDEDLPMFGIIDDVSEELSAFD